MIILPLKKLRAKMGKFYTPVLLVLFFLCLFLTLLSSVVEKQFDYKEGQVASESVRANKTIENKVATEQKRQLAAEAVAPEYTFQQELGQTQHQRIAVLFDLIDQVNSDLQKEYEAEQKKAKDKSEIPAPTVDEKVAALKKSFETADAESVEFYQQLPTNFFQEIFALSADELKQVETQSLALIDEQMEKQIRDSNLATIRSQTHQAIADLEVNSAVNEAITELTDHAIVINDVLNEKKTEELRQEARNAVQPVMIYQGEVIVREGSQIDSSAMDKLKLLGLTSQTTSVFPIVAMVLSILLQIGVLLYFLQQFSSKEKQQLVLTFYVTAMTFSILLMKFFQLFETEAIQYIPLFYPAAFVPLVLNIFVNRRAGTLAALFQVVASLFIYYDSIGTNLLTIIMMAYLFSGLAGVIVKRIRISQQGWQAAMWIIVFPLWMIVILVVFQGLSFSDSKTWTTLICGLAGSTLSFLLTMGLHQYIELLVSDDSAIVLNELSNPNQPLLKQLLEEAPGTYHHSMMVANLSANAVAEIGGNSLLTRVACYYHDIGKLKHANFFVENLPDGAENPHNFLLPGDSKQIIFGHVINGAKILEEHKMPRMVIDICEQHHGTTLMKYFYIKAKERNPAVTEADFRYPGPKPQTREAGVVNIADSCEAAVRAMDHPTNEKIREFVKNLIKERILDGQLDETGLTLKEIHQIEDSLVNGLCSTFHSRIKYPKMKSEAEQMKEEQERSGK